LWTTPGFQVDEQYVMFREQAGVGQFPDGIYKFDWAANVEPGEYELLVSCTGGATLGSSVVSGFEGIMVIEVVA
jgi:hypothetical protein